MRGRDIRGHKRCPPRDANRERVDAERILVWHGQGERGLAGGRSGRLSAQRAYSLVELAEKFSRELLGGRIDQPGSELGKLAADLCFDIVGQHGCSPIYLKQNLSAALGKAGDPSGAFSGDAITVWRVEVR